MNWHIARIVDKDPEKFAIVGRIAIKDDKFPKSIQIGLDNTAASKVEFGEFSLEKSSCFLQSGTFFVTLPREKYSLKSIEIFDLTINYESDLITKSFDINTLRSDDGSLSIPLEKWLCQVLDTIKCSGNPETIWKNVDAILKSRYHFFASEILRCYLPRSIDMFSEDEKNYYAYCFDTLCNLLNYSSSIEGICSEEFKTNGDTNWYHTNIAHRNYRLQKKSIVSAEYRLASSLASKLAVIHFNKGIHCWRSDEILDEFESIDLDSKLDSMSNRPMQMSININSQDKIIHFVGCDDKYFKKFYSFMLRGQIIGRNMGSVLHFHVTNPSDETLLALDVISNSRSFRTNYSVDFVNSRYHRVEFYTCLRFLYASIIKQYDSIPIIITDVDISLSTNWSRLIDIVKDKSMGLRYHGSMNSAFDYENYFGVPWSVNAQNVYFSNDQVARTVLKNQSKYIIGITNENIEHENLSFWTVDQVALRLALDRHFPQNSEHEIVNLSVHALMDRAPKNVELGIYIDISDIAKNEEVFILKSISRLLKSGK